MPNDDRQFEGHEKQVWASWKYAILFSLLLSTSLWLLAGAWIWIRDGKLHDIDFLLVTWTFVNAVLIPTIKWDNSRR